MYSGSTVVARLGTCPSTVVARLKIRTQEYRTLTKTVHGSCPSMVVARSDERAHPRATTVDSQLVVDFIALTSNAESFADFI